MSQLRDLMAQTEHLDDEARRLCQALVEHYESELDTITAHLGQAYEEMTLLHEVGQEIASNTLETSVIADRSMDRIIDLLGAESGVVMVCDDESGSATAARPAGSHQPAAPLQPLIEWATERTMGRDVAMIVNEVGDGDVPPAPGIASLLSCPLSARGRVIGAVHVLNKGVAGGFTTEDQMLLQSIASQVGSAIENSRLYHLEQEHARDLATAFEELAKTYDDTLESLSGALDLRDNETEGHARRVTRYTVRIAEQAGLSGVDLLNIERGALLHDIGKIGVPDSILLKPGKLTEEEWAVMRTHPVLGHNMIRNINFLAEAAPIILHHHERFDGGGYPDRLTGNTIPIGARIFAIADTFDAMTSDRPYRKALPYDVAREEIERCAGSQFDPTVVAAFCQVPADEWEDIRQQVEQVLAAKRRGSGRLRKSD